MKRALLIVCQSICVLVVGCGSTSGLKSADGEKLVCDKQFERVQVVRFGQQVAKTDAPASKVAWACGHFADLIAQEINATGAFKDVSRVKDVNDASAETLIISGDVTRYTEGDSFARFMIGFGAGSSGSRRNVWA